MPPNPAIQQLRYQTRLSHRQTRTSQAHQHLAGNPHQSCPKQATPMAKPTPADPASQPHTVTSSTTPREKKRASLYFAAHQTRTKQRPEPKHDKGQESVCDHRLQSTRTNAEMIRNARRSRTTSPWRKPSKTKTAGTNQQQQEWHGQLAMSNPKRQPE